jgi:hypothetical protein
MRARRPPATWLPEGHVHAYLDHRVGQYRADLSHAINDEGLRTVGIMDVARALQKSEDLAGLGDSAKQGIITPLAFLFAVEADGGPFRIAIGAEHRAIEVEGDPSQSQGGEPHQYQSAEEAPKAAHTFFVRARQHPRQRGDVWQTRESQDTGDQGIIVVIADMAEIAVAEQRMDNEQQHDTGPSEDGAGRKVSEAIAESLLELEVGEQLLDQHQTGKRSKLLFLEPQLR